VAYNSNLNENYAFVCRGFIASLGQTGASMGTWNPGVADLSKSSKKRCSIARLQEMRLAGL